MEKYFKRCTIELMLSNPNIPIWSLLKNNRNLINFLGSRNVWHYSIYGYARVALLKGLEQLGFCKEHSILMPSYTCDVIVPPISMLENIKFYKVSSDLQPDVSDIESKINEKTKAIIIIKRIRINPLFFFWAFNPLNSQG